MTIRVLTLLAFLTLVLTCNYNRLKTPETLSTHKPPTTLPDPEPIVEVPLEVDTPKTVVKSKPRRTFRMPIQTLLECQTIMDTLEKGHKRTADALSNGHISQ